MGCRFTCTTQQLKMRKLRVLKNKHCLYDYIFIDEYNEKKV